MTFSIPICISARDNSVESRSTTDLAREHVRQQVWAHAQLAMRLQILHHAHEHEHEHARTVSLHPLLYPSPTHHAGTRVRAETVRRHAARAPPPQACHFSNNRVSHRHDAVFTSVAVVVDEADDANARTRASTRARFWSIDRVETRGAYRIDALASVSTHRRSSSSVVAVAAFGRSTRGVFVRVSRASTSKRSRGVGEDRGVKGSSTAFEASSESNAHVRRALTTREVERTSGNGDADGDAERMRGRSSVCVFS